MVAAALALAAPPVAPPSSSASARCSAAVSLACRARRDAAATLAALALFSAAPPAHALTSIALNNLRAETVPCPAGQTTSTIGKPRCLRVFAEATNPSNKTALNADVFGRVFGVDGSNALDRDEASDAGRISNLRSVPPGTSEVSFDLIVSDVAASRGLEFRRFKATAYPAAAPLVSEDDCDLTPVGCDGDLVP
jgi:hypothetical protein